MGSSLPSSVPHDDTASSAFRLTVDGSMAVVSMTVLEEGEDSFFASPKVSCVWLSMRATTARHMCRAVGLPRARRESAATGKMEMRLRHRDMGGAGGVAFEIYSRRGDKGSPEGEPRGMGEKLRMPTTPPINKTDRLDQQGGTHLASLGPMATSPFLMKPS